MRVRKVHLRARLERELSVSGEPFTAIPGERPCATVRGIFFIVAISAVFIARASYPPRAAPFYTLAISPSPSIRDR